MRTNSAITWISTAPNVMVCHIFDSSRESPTMEFGSEGIGRDQELNERR